MPTACATEEPPISWQALHAERSHLLRYARRRLLDPALAEDVVHDVFEAVLDGRARFGGRAPARAWLVGVLRHKIVDLIRSRSGTESLDAWIDQDGAAELVCPCGRPDERVEQRERLARVLVRVEQLPTALRRVMELRILHDRDSDDVCRDLDISPANLHVRLHRARRQLQAETAA